MEPEGSLPHLQVPATCHSELDQSSPSHPHPTPPLIKKFFLERIFMN